MLLFFPWMNNTNLYREAISALDWGPAVVIGHKNPDGDSVFSAMAYACLMRELGYNAVAKMAGPANKETVFAAKALGLELPEVLKTVGKASEPERLILVDHSDYAQSVDGARDARILQVIDHHGVGDITESKLLYAKYMPVGSTCSIVYTSFCELEVEITPVAAQMLLAGIMSDTLNLIKVTCTEVDRKIYRDLVGILALSESKTFDEKFKEIQEIYKGMAEASKNFDGMTDLEVFNADAKDYDIEGVKFRLGSMDWDHPDTIDEFLDRMLLVMKSQVKGISFCRVGYMEHSYILYNGAKKLAETAFGASIRPGIVYCERRLSRKLDVVPMLTAKIGLCKDKLEDSPVL